MSITMTPTPTGLTELLATAAARAREAGVFGTTTVSSGRLEAAAKNSAHPAHYRLDWQGDRLCVSLVTAARYLSQSIEADLVHTGDKLSELLEEELAELGYEGPTLPVEHYRDDDKLFTFRTPLFGPWNGGESASRTDLAVIALLGYEAMFRQLGDMEADEED